MSSFTVTDLEVVKLLSNLNPNKATVPDGISLANFKELVLDIAPILESLNRHLLDRRKVPSDWREATVTPVYRKRLVV